MIIGQSRTSNTFVDTYAINNITANGGTISFTNGVNPSVGTHSTNDGPVWTGSPATKTSAEVTGDAAKTNLSGLDFTNTWTVVPNGTPMLKCFVQ